MDEKNVTDSTSRCCRTALRWSSVCCGHLWDLSNKVKVISSTAWYLLKVLYTLLMFNWTPSSLLWEVIRHVAINAHILYANIHLCLQPGTHWRDVEMFYSLSHCTPQKEHIKMTKSVNCHFLHQESTHSNTKWCQQYTYLMI